jgi:hypothetical protein
MADRRHVPEPGEMVYTPRPSWGPAFFALGALAVVCSIFSGSFGLPPIVFMIVGVILILLAFRSIVRSSIRDYYRLPRRQETRGAALPVETISTPPKP